MPRPRRQFIDGTHGQMHLRLARPADPTDRPLLCLHMFPQSGRNFERLLEVTSQRRIVVAPDFPGYGESDPPAEPMAASGYAGAIWEVVDALSLTASHGSIDVFGIHAGAKLSVELAHQRPADVHRIVLSSAAVLYLEELAQIKSSLAPIPLDDEGTRFQHLWQLLVRNRGPEMTLEMLATGLAEMLRGGERFEWGHDAVFEYNSQFPEVLRSLPHPIALLNPGDDLFEMTPRSLPYIQNGELLEFPQWGHGFLEIHAEEVARVVDAFLSKPPTNDTDS